MFERALFSSVRVVEWCGVEDGHAGGSGVPAGRNGWVHLLPSEVSP